MSALIQMFKYANLSIPFAKSNENLPTHLKNLPSYKDEYYKGWSVHKLLDNF